MKNKYDIVKVPLPAYMPGSHQCLFEKKSNYKCRTPKIVEVSNAFVTYQGLVIKNGFLVKGCAFNLNGNEDNTFYYPLWRNAIEQYAVCRWGKSLPYKNLKGPQKYLLIHSKWFNFSFWINGFLPRLLMAEEQGLLNQVKLIVPESWEKIPFVWESLKPFSLKLEIIPRDYHLFVEHLVLPETRQWTASFYPPLIGAIKKKLLLEAEKHVNGKGGVSAKKIYLTRSKRGVRCLENDQEISQQLSLRGFKTIAFEELSIWEQINIMKNSSCFISIHGAGFSNAMFMPEGSVAIELMSKPFAEFSNPFPHWKLCGAANVKYGLVLGDVEENLQKRLFESNANFRMRLVDQNIYVSPVELNAALDALNC